MLRVLNKYEARVFSLLELTAVAAAFIIGAIYFAMGDSEKGKKYVAGAIIGAIIMAFYTAIITGLMG